jgi:hypothetical protein
LDSAPGGRSEILEIHVAQLRAEKPAVDSRVIEKIVATQQVTMEIIERLKGKVDRIESQPPLTRGERREIQQVLAEAAEAKIELKVQIGRSAWTQRIRGGTGTERSVMSAIANSVRPR